METPNDTRSAETGRPSSAYSGGLHGATELCAAKDLWNSLRKNRMAYVREKMKYEAFMTGKSWDDNGLAPGRRMHYLRQLRRWSRAV